MKTELELNEKIVELTNSIRKNHPELVKFLDELPITVPYQENPSVTIKALSDYYDSLVKLVKGYEKNSKENSSEAIGSLPATEIVKMEKHNSYKNRIIEVNNVQLSYNDVGEGNILVLFLHGFPFDKAMWKEQLDFLKSTNRLIAIDIRGFGESTDEDSKLSMDLFADDLIALLDKLNIEKVVICGLSMGGFIALNAVKRFPERFEALILCDTQCIADTADVKKNRMKTIEQINSEGPEEFNEKFVKSVFHPNSLKNKKELVNYLRTVVYANSKEVLTRGLTALAERSETCSTLDKIHIPTLIICGRQDEVTPLSESEFMHKHISKSDLKVIENAGHVSNLEHPEEFNIYLKEFLEKL